jgi:hypothetical protein
MLDACTFTLFFSPNLGLVIAICDLINVNFALRSRNYTDNMVKIPIEIGLILNTTKYTHTHTYEVQD